MTSPDREKLRDVIGNILIRHLGTDTDRVTGHILDALDRQSPIVPEVVGDAGTAAELLSALRKARDQLVAWMLGSLTPDQAVKNVSHIDAVIDKARSATPSAMLTALKLAEPILAGCDSGGMSCGRELAAVREAIAQAGGARE